MITDNIKKNIEDCNEIVDTIKESLSDEQWLNDETDTIFYTDDVPMVQFDNKDNFLQ